MYEADLIKGLDDNAALPAGFEGLLPGEPLNKGVGLEEDEEEGDDEV
jgi:hypothetical protein